MSKWGELVIGTITRPTWGALDGRVDIGAKWLALVTFAMCCLVLIFAKSCWTYRV